MAKPNPNGKTVVPDTRLRIPDAAHCRIGDRVMMAVRSNDDGWTPRRVENGTVGSVIGFNRYRFFNGRLSAKPGEWAGNGNPIVAWDNGVDDVPSPQDMVYVDKRMQARKDLAWYEAFKRHQLVGKLPDTPFYEEDICTIKNGVMVKVTVIDYQELNALNDEGKPVSCYCVRYLDSPSTSSYLRADQLTLHARGTVWTWYNDRPAFDALSLETKIDAHVRMKMYDDMRNPRTDHFDWTQEDLDKAAKDGIIDVVRDGAFIQAFHLHDRELGAASNKVLCEKHLRV